jgi:hypothetical protein
MHILLLALAAAVPAAPTPELNKPGWQCQNTTSHHAVQRGRAKVARKLSELPTANMYKSVYRRIGGCEVPLVARYGIGGAR